MESYRHLYHRRNQLIFFVFFLFCASAKRMPCGGAFCFQRFALGVQFRGIKKGLYFSRYSLFMFDVTSMEEEFPKLLEHHSPNPAIADGLEYDGNNQRATSKVAGEIHFYWIIAQVCFTIALMRFLLGLLCRPARFSLKLLCFV